MDTVLLPGEVVFEVAPFRIRTILGSCVALAAWHPSLQVGGMCHYLLAERQDPKRPHDERYADIALEKLLLKMGAVASPTEYKLGLFGGSRLFGEFSRSNIGGRNVEFALQWLTRQSLTLESKDVLGDMCRTLVFDLSDGSFQMNHYRQNEEA